jgi:uncharacterized protein YkwD
MVKNKVFIFIGILITALLLVLIFWKDISDFYSELIFRLPEIKKEAEKQISLPSPLRSEEEHPESFLTEEGVIEWTNIQREKYGILPLKENAKLNEIAEAKLQDMFENQYFAHDSPTGQRVADLAEKFSYEFLSIGENLALGNFQNDEVLVDAWMNSPGHRANVLNSSYQEIGVAVGKGMFEGKTTWIAVQNFGLSLSVCAQPDLFLKAEIDENQKQISVLKAKLLSLEDEIGLMSSSRKREEGYLQKVEQYNTTVSQHNALVEKNRILINKYNSQVNSFNQCVAEFTH